MASKQRCGEEEENGGGKEEVDMEWWRGGELEHGVPRKERRKRQQRAVVDITAVIHLSDSPPNAPLGETQSCVTSNAANKQCEHTCLHTCTYGNRGKDC